jgi:glycosyltransferase involved in cell wall biosynthesis
MSKIKILHVISDIHLSSGGPSQSVVELLNSLTAKNDIELILLAVKLKGENNYGPINYNIVQKIIHVNSKIEFIFPLMKIIKLLLNFQKVNIIHMHGMWLPIYIIMYIYARLLNIKLIFQPRGMLEPWSLSQRSTIKKVALITYQNKIIKNANVIIATSDNEKKNIEKLNLNKNIRIVFNAMKEPNEKIVSTNQHKNKRVLFMSRLHEKKGIKILLEAWAEIDTKNWTLIIAGPNDENYAINQLTLNKTNVKYIGPIYGQVKYKLMSKVDLFILPSYSENFGNIILEAMMSRLPVITTVNTPWNEIIDYKAGWYINANVYEIKKALTEALNSDLHLMGNNAYNLSKKYNLTNTSSKIYSIYKEI